MGDNELYVLHADGSVFEHPISPGSCFPATSCSGFDQVDQVGSSDRALAANAGYLYVLHADGSVFQRFASAGSCSSITSCTGYSEIDQVGSTDGALATTHPGAQGPACDAGDLNVSLDSFQGAAGTGYYTFGLLNRGDVPCQVGGYFGVSIFGVNGQLLVASVPRAPVTADGAGVTPILLGPGVTATFVVSVVENGTARCPSIGTFDLIPPDAYSPAVVQVSSLQQGGFCSSRSVEPTQLGWPDN